MSQIAIDFKQLRKLEKLRVREEMLDSRRNNGNENENENGSGKTSDQNTIRCQSASASTETECADNNSGPNSNPNHDDTQSSGYNSQSSSSALVMPQCPCTPCTPSTMNNLDEILHNHKVSNSNSVCSELYYVRKFLSPEFSSSLIEWLKTLPHTQRGQGQGRGQDTSESANSKNDDQFNGKWTTLKYARRNVAMFDLNSYASATTSTSAKSRNACCVPESVPPQVPVHLQSICDILVSMNAFPSSNPPNHVLINEYSGQGGILPHTDGPIYLDRTATVSVGGGDVIFQFTRRGVPAPTTVPASESKGGEDDIKQRLFKDAGEDVNVDVPVDSRSNSDSASDSPVQIKLHGQGSLVVFAGDAYTKYCHSIQDRVDDMVEYAGANCINAAKGEAVERGYRISLTFRHKYC